VPAAQEAFHRARSDHNEVVSGPAPPLWSGQVLQRAGSPGGRLPRGRAGAFG